MSLSSLHIKNLRNLAEVRIEPASRLNIIHGANASGKTSLLEAIYLLGRAKSFRSSHLHIIEGPGKSGFMVFGQVTGELGIPQPLGVHYEGGKIHMRAAGQALTQTAELVKRLPLLLITPDSHKILTLGPRQRRRFIDWGVFHVEHDFILAYRRYCRALRQRNASLRTPSRFVPSEIWDNELYETAAQIDGFRRDYLQQFLPLLIHFVKKLLPADWDVSLRYLPGWAQDMTFREALTRSLERDRLLGYTHKGPHRADVVIEAAGKPVQEHASGGQQKLLMCALYLAQAALFKARTQRQCIILLDDLPAELDAEHRCKLMELLCEIGVQIIVTTTDKNLLRIPEGAEAKLFHVEHGVIMEQGST
jgi:DNA replication and repair protein RecF